MAKRDEATTFEELRNATLPLDDPTDPRSNPEDYGHVHPLPEEILHPVEQLRAEDIARMALIPDTHPSVKVVNVGPSGTGGSSTHESRGGTYPFHPGGAYLPSEKDQAEADRNARRAAKALRDLEG